MRLWLRSNSLVPMLSSSFASCWESEGWARPSLLARMGQRRGRGLRHRHEDVEAGAGVIPKLSAAPRQAAARPAGPTRRRRRAAVAAGLAGGEDAAFPPPWQGQRRRLGRHGQDFNGQNLTNRPATRFPEHPGAATFSRCAQRMGRRRSTRNLTDRPEHPLLFAPSHGPTFRRGTFETRPREAGRQDIRRSHIPGGGGDCGRRDKSTAIKKQSYIRFADELPRGVSLTDVVADTIPDSPGRSPNDIRRPPCSSQVNIWQRFQMPAHGRKGRQRYRPGARRTAHRHARRQALQPGYSADRQRPVHAKPARSTPPNRSRQTQPGFYHFQRALTGGGTSRT